MLPTKVIYHGSSVLNDHLAGWTEIPDMGLSVHISVMSLAILTVLRVDPTQLAEVGAFSNNCMQFPVI